MSDNGNTVNIKRGAYHHGDLRSTLLAEGLGLLAERSADSVSLREVARRAGVTATSVYRHFPDKEALLTALARDGLTRLAAAQRAASEAAGGGIDGFAATGVAYVRFALSNPALFRLIFSSSTLTSEMTGETSETEPGMLLHANAAAKAAKIGGNAQVHAVQAWAYVHGLAILMLDGQLPADDGLVVRVINAWSTAQG